MKNKLKYKLLLVLVMVFNLSFSQEFTVTGVVSGETDNMPLPGVSVIVKGTTTGAQTNFDGEYSIKAEKGSVLVFSFLGMKSQEIKVDSSKLDVLMMEDASSLDEVVIEAFRTSTKQTSNVSSVTISSSTIEARPNASIVQTLQGQVAGMNITTFSGQPGANSTITIRGIGSINGNTEPLFVIDGIPVDEDNFRSLNPNEITSLTVLKDAGATSIYGNRGANGVVVIKTKRGSYESGLKVNYLGQSSFSLLQGHDYNLMNSRQLLNLEKAKGSGLGASLSDAEIEALALQSNTNWLDVFYGTGLTNSHTLTLSQGGSNLNSFTSLGYNETEGTLKDVSDLKRFNFRNNLNGKSDNGKFQYGTSLSINYSESNEPNQVGSGAVNRNFILGANKSVPYLSVYDYEPGKGSEITASFLNTPLMLLDRKDTYVRKEDEIKILANLNASYNFTDFLSFTTSLSTDFTNETLTRAEAPNSFNAQFFAEDGNTTPGFQQQYSDRVLALNFNNSLKYLDTFDDKHTVEVSLSSEYFKAHQRFFSYFAEGLSPKNFYPGDGAAFIDDNSDNDFFVDDAGANVQNAGLLSFFVFADYDYDKKYGFSATARRDASYRFADSNKWGTFYSFSGRWNIHNESFMDSSPFSLLKLRGSYGTAGNDRVVNGIGTDAYFVGANLTQELYGTGSTYQGQNGLFLSQLPNPDLRWETVAQANVGVDFEIWNKRLRGSFDVYRKTTDDLYISRSISPALNGGVSTLNANVGKMKNEGIDAELNYQLIKPTVNEGLSVLLKGLINYNKQELLDLGTEGDIIGSTSISAVGGVLGENYRVPYLGVNPANGNLLFLDINGNVTENTTNDDRRRTGKNSVPDYQGSFGFEIDYKNFFLTTQFNYAIGVWRNDFEYSGYIDSDDIGQFNVSNDLSRAWTPDNRITDIPSLFATNIDAGDLSDRFLFNSDYVRLRFIQFGYNLPKRHLDKLGLSRLRFFANGENIITLSGWRGFDAEATGQYGYPTPKTYSVGIELGL